MNTTKTIIAPPRITFEEARKSISKMNLIDGFLFDSAIENKEDAEIVIGGILRSIFDRKFKSITVTSQKQLQAVDTEFHGIRFDAYVDEDEENNEDKEDKQLNATVYDVEMENRKADKKELPKRLRYYQAIHDSKLLEASADYDKIPNFISITILSYDPFGAGDMCYEAKTKLTTHPEIDYEDGVLHLFFYCYGEPNIKDIAHIVKSESHGKKLQEMLKYIVSGEKPTSFNEVIEDVDKVVTKVKGKKEVTIEYMRQIDREYSIRKETAEATKREAAIEMIRFDIDNDITKAQTIVRVKMLGLNDVDIENLYQQVADEQKAVIT